MTRTDAFHRVLSGSPLRRGELIAAGLFIAFWFASDMAQFADFVVSKLHPTSSCILSFPTTSTLDVGVSRIVPATTGN